MPMWPKYSISATLFASIIPRVDVDHLLQMSHIFLSVFFYTVSLDARGAYVYTFTVWDAHWSAPFLQSPPKFCAGTPIKVKRY